MLFLGIVLGYIVLGWLSVQWMQNVSSRYDRANGVTNPGEWEAGALWSAMFMWPLAFAICLGCEIGLLIKRIPTPNGSFSDWFFFTDAHK